MSTKKVNKIAKAENQNDAISQMKAFVEIVKILRKECPWDKKQTHKSISHLMIEETYEAVDAIFKQDFDELAKELGDILLHIVMQSLIAEEENRFTFADVIQKISEKMILRHPHIFNKDNALGNITEEKVLENWEKIKMTEGRKSVLEGVPNSLPALLKAERIQEKAAKVGFDWDNKNDVWKKVEEEIGELKHEIEFGDKDKIEDELGDVIFAIVNAARFEKIVPENALQRTNNKFIRRFQYIEQKAKANNLDLKEMTLAEMDEFWNEAKALEKIEKNN
jgi:XTP/dITP diphosphohydrolase